MSSVAPALDPPACASEPGAAGALEIDSLDLEGRGVARRGGKVVFVAGGLPGERVQVRTLRAKASYEIARALVVERASVERRAPRCRHFGFEPGSCGGCSMQHLDPRTQVAVKQRVLEDALWHGARLRPQLVLRPIFGPPWAYRQRARMAVREVAKKGGVLVGFHERASSYVADLHECPVMPQRIAGLLLPLRALFGALTIRRRLPQVELALGAGDDLVLVLRVLDPPTAAVRLWLQPLGPDSAEPLTADDAGPLLLDLDEFGLRLPFLPTDFTQVNHCINEVLVRTVVRMLTAPPGGVTIDFFCGLGNFTLPIAAGGARVLGFEGSRALVERARAAAAFNRLEHRARFAVRDLSRWTAADWPETVDQCAAMFRQQPDGPEPGSAQHQVPSPGSQLATGEPRLGLGCSTIERVLLDPPRWFPSDRRLSQSEGVAS